MGNISTQFVSLTELSRSLKLPKTYLVEFANKGLIPHLNVNGRLRFNPAAVQQALDKLAAKGGHNEQK